MSTPSTTIVQSIQNNAYQRCADRLRANFVPLHTNSMSPETVLEMYTIDPSAFILLNSVLNAIANEIEAGIEE